MFAVSGGLLVRRSQRHARMVLRGSRWERMTRMSIEKYGSFATRSITVGAAGDDPGYPVVSVRLEQLLA